MQHYKALFTLGIPIVIGQIGVIILGFADTLMIGHHSTNELAAASFVNNMFTLAIIFATGFSYGLTPIVGSLFGRGETHVVGRMLKNSLFANTLLAVLLTLIMWILYLNIHRLGQPEELLPLMRPYFIVLLISLLFVLLFNGFKQFADGITDTRVSMWILLTGNVMNIIGNYILIYGKLGMPEMGLLGAGISTLASRIMMVIVFAVIFFCTRRYHIYKEGFLTQYAQPGRLPAPEQTGMAHCHADGNGNCFVQSQCHYGGMDRDYCSGGPPSDARHFPNLLYDVLWHGSSRCRAG